MAYLRFPWSRHLIFCHISYSVFRIAQSLFFWELIFCMFCYSYTGIRIKGIVPKECACSKWTNLVLYILSWEERRGRRYSMHIRYAVMCNWGLGGGGYSPLFGVGIGPIKVLDIPLGNSEQFDNKLQSWEYSVWERVLIVLIFLKWWAINLVIIPFFTQLIEWICRFWLFCPE